MSSAKDRREAERLLADLDVSRETWERLDRFVALLERWQGAQNLVGPATLASVWTRHIADSLQLMAEIPDRARVADLGSGAGFPGFILAIGFCDRPEADRPKLHLVESNRRKAAFLRIAAAEAGVAVDVHAERAEQVFGHLNDLPGGLDIITARALAPVHALLEMTEPATRNGVICLFHKGRGLDSELLLAREDWSFTVKTIPSRVSNDSAIACLSDIRRNAST